jgi:hypothetical protein
MQVEGAAALDTLTKLTDIVLLPVLVAMEELHFLYLRALSGVLLMFVVAVAELH